MKLGSIIAGKFRIDRVIGRGAMGVVLEATDMTLGRRVAVKLILPQHAQHPELRGRFIREATVMTRLASEHVARVLEVGELEDGMLFLAMEYLEGQSLEQLIESSNGLLPVADAVDLILEALDAITEAHELGLVHRDLKPSNMFLCARKGRDPIVKVLDFGIVKDTTATGGAKLTATGTLPGTPAYMAPEQVALEEAKIDARADVWSLGVTLYEVLTGELPFNGPINVMLTRIRSEAPPRLRAKRPDVAFELEAIVDRCLSKNPRDRYANAGELSMALTDLRMRGLVRSERGAERRAATTAINAHRAGGGARRQTVETEAELASSPVLRANERSARPSAERGGATAASSGRVFPFALFVIGVCVVAGVVLAMQGRLSSSAARSGAAEDPTNAASAAIPTSSSAVDASTSTNSAITSSTQPSPPLPGSERVPR